MTTFTTRPLPVFIMLKSWLITCCMVAVFFVGLHAFTRISLKDGYYYITGALLLINLFDSLNKYRVYEISFDAHHRQILFSARSLFSGGRQTVLPYENARVEIIYGKAAVPGKQQLRSLVFLTRKHQVIQVDTRKDGFSAATLQQVYQAVLELGLPVTTV